MHLKTIRTRFPSLWLMNIWGVQSSLKSSTHFHFIDFQNMLQSWVHRFFRIFPWLDGFWDCLINRYAWQIAQITHKLATIFALMVVTFFFLLWWLMMMVMVVVVFVVDRPRCLLFSTHTLPAYSSFNINMFRLFLNISLFSLLVAFLGLPDKLWHWLWFKVKKSFTISCVFDWQYCFWTCNRKSIVTIWLKRLLKT